MFFGRDNKLGIPVVLKQYKNKKALMTEFRIYSLLEALRANKRENVLLKSQISECEGMNGLPQMLAYIITKEISEILLTHEGNHLATWMSHINSSRVRISMACEMLRQCFRSI